MSVTCTICREDYEDWAVVDGEPCPKVRCSGTIESYASAGPGSNTPDSAGGSVANTGAKGSGS